MFPIIEWTTTDTVIFTIIVIIFLSLAGFGAYSLLTNVIIPFVSKIHITIGE
jgi:hypothetical protein